VGRIYREDDVVVDIDIVVDDDIARSNAVNMCLPYVNFFNSVELDLTISATFINCSGSAVCNAR
jgi:hypothetical protein